MGIFSELTSQVVPLVAVIGLLYMIGLPIYRLLFSPLSKFPGPKLAAATLWYEFYYDVILNGRYEWKIEELHEQYGPIVRINPFELHINDPEYFDVLYSNNVSLDKSPWYVNQFDMHHTAFSTIGSQHHRIRRAALNPYFSKQMINRLEPLLQTMVTKLCQRLDGFRGTNKPVEMRTAYSALTTDIITAYAFNESWGHLDSPDFKKDWYDGVHTMIDGWNSLKHFSWLFGIMKSIPQSWAASINPFFAKAFMYENRVKDQTDRVIAGTYKPGKDTVGSGLNTTIMHALLESDLPAEEKSPLRLWKEGMAMVGAGSETTANTLSMIHFHVLDNPSVYDKLKAELRGALLDKDTPVALNVVEKLPYLTAVINEGLRMSSGVSSRLGRINPTAPMKFRQWIIPAGATVGMTPMFLNYNEAIFTDAQKFSPERWLDRSSSKQLDKNMVSFSKGPRACIGINLAKAELYLGIASIYRKFERMELFETTRRDVQCAHDNFIPHAAMDSQGVRVVYA